MSTPDRAPPPEEHLKQDFYFCVLVVTIKGRVPNIAKGTTAEAQKPGWQGGIATRKVFARPESFCA